MCKPIFDDQRVLAAETFFRSGRRPVENSASEIKFETPVNFTEIKILSPDMYLSTSNGGLILGATDPSEFSIQFFCNNVHRPDSTSLINLGTLDYKEELSTILDCHTNIWSDKLIVDGIFSSITVVVYGTPIDVDVDFVQKRDRSCNLPLLEVPGGGAPEIMGLANDYLGLDDDIVTDRFDLSEDSNDSNDGKSGSEQETDDKSNSAGETATDNDNTDSEVTDESNSGEEEEGEEEEEEGEEEEEEEEDDDEEGEEEDDDDDHSSLDESDQSNSSDITDNRSSDLDIITDRAHSNFTNDFSNSF